MPILREKTYITYRAAFSISCRAKARLLFSYDFKIADICPPNLRVHHAAFHTGNHELSLSGLKRSFGNWRKPGNQRQLGASWCKAEKKKKNLPPLLPGTSCLPVPLARLSFLLPSHVISVICLSSLAGVFHMSYFQVHLNKQESILLYISISSQIPSKLPLFAPLIFTLSHFQPLMPIRQSAHDRTSWKPPTREEQSGCRAALMHAVSSSPAFFPTPLRSPVSP